MKIPASFDNHRASRLYINNFGCGICHENIGLVGVAVWNEDLELQRRDSQIDGVVILDRYRHVGDDR